MSVPRSRCHSHSSNAPVAVAATPTPAIAHGRPQFGQQRTGGAQQRPHQVQAARDRDRPVGFAVGRRYLGWSPGTHAVPVCAVLASILT